MSSLIEDPGLAVVEHIFKEMKIDREWSTRQERGFTWWGKDFAQTVWAEPPFEDSGFRITRVHARTDVATGFKGTPENWNESFERAFRAKIETMQALGEVFTKKGNKKTKGTPRRAR